MALSFTPDPYALSATLRLRTRGRPHGVLLQLTDHHRTAALTLHVRGGVACGSLWFAGSVEVREACADGFPLGDGVWHTLTLERHGHNLRVLVDDGDAWRRNETLPSLLTPVTVLGHSPDTLIPEDSLPRPIMVDKDTCCVVGGDSEIFELGVHDLRGSCVNDLRISGYPIALTATEDDTWGRVVAGQHVTPGCPAPSTCTNTTCVPPLACHNSWTLPPCSCGPGQHVVGRACHDVDECLFDPCLNGGECHNLSPGYRCLCPPGSQGQHCQWSNFSQQQHHMAIPIIVSAITLTSILLVVVLMLVLRARRQHRGRGIALRCDGVAGLTGTSGTPDSLAADTQYLQAPVPDSFLGAIKSSGSIKGSGARLLHIVGKGSPGTKSRPSGADPLVEKVSVITPPDLTPEKHTASPPPTAHQRPPTTIPCDVGVGVGVGVRRVSVGGIKVDGQYLKGRTAALPLPTQDDLRAYAYEGDGSPTGSLTSTVLGLRAESLEDESLRPLVAEYGEVFDLLRNLPDGRDTSSLGRNTKSSNTTSSLPRPRAAKGSEAPSTCCPEKGKEEVKGGKGQEEGKEGKEQGQEEEKGGKGHRGSTRRSSKSKSSKGRSQSQSSLELSTVC